MKRTLLTVLSLFGAALPAQATWSIVVVDHATGEVAIASATCLANFPLELNVPAIVVGKGAIAAQSILDSGGTNRMIAFDLLKDDATPEEILDALLTIGTSPGMRQYGIAAFAGPAATYSGSGAGDGRGNLIGTFGTMTYAIQGNLLVGSEPVFAAEEAFRATDGDMGQRVMSAMHAAKSLGGDGRCSCSGGDPTGCGSPPPSFTKSAHCGFVYVARMGDVDGTCGAGGCVNGDYYLELAYSGDVADPDPVDVLQGFYDAWRAGLAGRPDGILSTVERSAERLPADGVTSAGLTIRLVDVDGVALTTGGATVTVALAPTATADVTLGPVTDHGDGSYSFDVTAGLLPGVAELVIVAGDGVQQATLYPNPTLNVDTAAELHVGASAVDPFAGATVPLTLNLPQAAGAQYVVLASLSGTVPGTVVQGVTLPLNFDDVLLFSLQSANTGPLQNTFGLLDGSGRASATFAAPPGFLLPAAGMRLDWAALYLNGPTLGASNADGFDVGLGS